MFGELTHHIRIEKSYYQGRSNNIYLFAEKEEDSYLILEKVSDLKKVVLSTSEF